LYGPWNGHLDNRGDDLQLSRPEIPIQEEVPYILVERVTFSDQAPWPSASDGFGPTLQRISSTGFGDDPTNWVAAAPSPGEGLAGGARPIIVAQPADQLLPTYRAATLSVIATGDAPVRYLWKHDGLPIFGGTNSSLTISNVQPSDAGMYSVLAYNGGGATLGTNFFIRTRFGLHFIQQPTNLVGVVGSTFAFAATAVGFGSVSYQWEFNGISIFGATNSTLIISNAGVANQGRYVVQASDAYDTFASQPATLSTLLKPAITLQPLSQSVPENGVVAFTVAASGTLPVGFRWRTNGFTFTNAMIINSPDTSTLLLLNVPSNFNGFRFTAAITNIVGSAPLTSNAVLTVLSDSDHDGLPDLWEINRPGFNIADAADGNRDDDGDGMSNAAEFLAGTDYLDAASCLRLSLALMPTRRLWFDAVSNHTYSIQFSESFEPSSWTKIADILAHSTNRTEILTLPGSTGSGFYRLVTPIQP
jgi:hypothetical protein